MMPLLDRLDGDRDDEGKNSEGDLESRNDPASQRRQVAYPGWYRRKAPIRLMDDVGIDEDQPVDRGKNHLIIEEAGADVSTNSNSAPRVLKRCVSSMSAMPHPARKRHDIFKILKTPVLALLSHRKEREQEYSLLPEQTEQEQQHRVSFPSLHSQENTRRESEIPKQYTIKSTRAYDHPMNFELLRRLGIRLEIDDMSGTTRWTFRSVSVEQLVIDYLHWSFRSSFLAFFFSTFVGIWVLSLLFAVGVWNIGQAHPKCIAGVDFESEPYFLDIFGLSWVTFATVRIFISTQTKSSIVVV